MGNSKSGVLNYTNLLKILSRKSNFTPTDEVMQKIVVLALLTGTIDGRLVQEELNVIDSNMKNRFNKREQNLLKYLSGADKYIDSCDPKLLLKLVCEDLRVMLTQRQILDIYDFLSDIIVADSIVSNEEKDLLSELAVNFDITALINSTKPDLQKRGAYWNN